MYIVWGVKATWGKATQNLRDPSLATAPVIVLRSSNSNFSIFLTSRDSDRSFSDNAKWHGDSAHAHAACLAAAVYTVAFVVPLVQQSRLPLHTRSQPIRPLPPPHTRYGYYRLPRSSARAEPYPSTTLCPAELLYCTLGRAL